MNIKAWAQLLRLPNLFTVPGDPVAGFFLACTVSSCTEWWLSFAPYGVSLASLFFYCSGLLQNDYYDREVDRQERPFRSIPSGRVTARSTICVSTVFALAAMIISFSVSFASGVTGIVLMAAITTYNRWAKRKQVIGPICMGLCRGLSLLLGATALWPAGVFTPAVAVSAVFLALFIATVTHIAAGEAAEYRSGSVRWAPAATLLAWVVGMHLVVQPSSLTHQLVSLLLATAASVWMIRCGSLLVDRASPAVIQSTIGKFIRGLLLIQGALVGLAGDSALLVIMTLLLAWPISQTVGRRFYAS